MRSAAGRAGEDGSAAVEFMLASPALFAILVGFVEVAMLLIVALSLGDASLQAARFGATGDMVPGRTREQEIRRIIDERTLGLLRVDDLAVETRVYPNLPAALAAEWLDDRDGDGDWTEGEWFDDANGNGLWDGDLGDAAAGPGGSSAIVVYRVAYDWTPMTMPALPPVTLRAAVPIRNEPF